MLKLHGSIEEEYRRDIVLTREDFIRYPERRAALAGIVQALLITRHMLFVGFSLSDDNFHRVVDAVRRAIRRPAQAPTLREPFGTALLLSDQGYLKELFEKDIDVISMANSNALWDLEKNVSPAARDTPAWQDLRRLLAQMGTTSG